MGGGTWLERVAALAVALALAQAVPPAAKALEASVPRRGEVVAAKPAKVEVSVRFVGSDGVWAEVGELELFAGASAWDATREALTSSGLAYQTGTSSATDAIVSLTRPSDGTTHLLDPSTGSGWHLFRNGERYLGSSSTVVLSDGDELEWRYEVGTLMVRVSVVGPGGAGDSYWVAPTSVRMQTTQTVWDASLEVFRQNGYGGGHLLSYETRDDGSVELESLAALGENGITGESWQVFVNGEVAQGNAALTGLRAGDSICWYYAGRGVSELPAFVEQTGAAAQNPAELVRVEGIVAQVWVASGGEGAWEVPLLDRVAGVVVGKGAFGVAAGAGASLAREDEALRGPLARLFAEGAWGASLAHALERRVASGEGVSGAFGLDGSLYYVSDSGDVVKLGQI